MKVLKISFTSLVKLKESIKLIERELKIKSAISLILSSKRLYSKN